MDAGKRAIRTAAKSTAENEESPRVVEGPVVDQREKWGSQMEFLLSCIGYSVGLGNVWRFPYLCYKNGGATFMLVYLFLQLTIGKALYFMELAAGQFSGKSAVRFWDMNPAARGVGLSMCLVSLNISLYYNIIMAYILYYFFASFDNDLPWNQCRPEWENCFTQRSGLVILPVCQLPTASSRPTENCTCSGDDVIDTFYNCSVPFKHSTDFYFKKVVNQADNISDFGRPSRDLSLLLLLSWVIVILTLSNGIKTSGKVVYFTATFPYFVLIIMLIRGSLLDGAMEGVKLIILPKWSELGQLQLWVDAAGQMFFSLSLSMGGNLMFGSYNDFRNPIYRDTVIISSTDLMTSVLAGFVIFTTLGYMAKQTGKEILEVADTSYGLVFIAYPESLSSLAVPNLWACLFFFMLYTLGLDSQFALLETVLNYLIDDFRWCRTHKLQLRMGMGLLLYLLGLPLVCPGGPYLIGALDVYGATFVLTFISMAETMSVMWVYGVNRFLNDLEYMLGKKPCALPYWYFVWVVWSPLLLFGLFLMGATKSETPKYADGTLYGPEMLTFCWFLFAEALAPIPLWFCLHLRAVHRKSGPFPSWKQFIKAVFEPSKRWGPADGSNPQNQARIASVWADVLDWKIFQVSQSRPRAPTKQTRVPDRNLRSPEKVSTGPKNTETVEPETSYVLLKACDSSTVDLNQLPPSRIEHTEPASADATSAEPKGAEPIKAKPTGAATATAFAFSGIRSKTMNTNVREQTD